FTRKFSKDESRIRDTTAKFSKKEFEAYNLHVKSTVEGIYQRCKAWLEGMAAIGQDRESTETVDRKHKKSSRISVLAIMPKAGGHEHSEGYPLPPVFPGCQNPTAIQAQGRLLPPVASSSSMVFANTVPLEQSIYHNLPGIGNGPGTAATDSHNMGVDLAETWPSIDQDWGEAFTPGHLRECDLIFGGDYSNPSAELSMVPTINRPSVEQAVDLTAGQEHTWM
ncbi:hypothetical protein QQX98_012346, partial [Neonectria punicea]